MADVKITKKPNGKVYSMCSPKRINGYWAWESKWKIPTALTKGSNNARATGFEIEYELGMGRGAKNPKIKFGGATGFNSSSVYINSKWDFTNLKQCTREKFYPVTSAKLYKIWSVVRAKNSKGYGEGVKTHTELEFPDPPRISAITQIAESGVVRCTVKTDHGWNSNKEAYDTRYKIIVEKHLKDRTTIQTVEDKVYRYTEFDVSYDVGDRQQFDYDEYVTVTVEAWARGLRGDSKHATRSIVVGYPALPTIKKVDAPSKDGTSKVTVHINTNRSTAHPCTGVQLEILTGTKYKQASEIPATAVWEPTDSVDNGVCTALAISTQELLPAPGYTTWVRVKSWNQIEGLFYRYSAPVRVTNLESPEQTAAFDQIKLLSLVPGTDGESAVASMAWINSDSEDVPRGTELTWSDDENAWRSTDAPSKYEFDWSDGGVEIEGVTYDGSATVHIRGLSEGTQYFVRARRWREGDTTTYSSYTDPQTVVTTVAPSSATLIAPGYVARGSSLGLSWVHDSESEQTSWELIDAVTEAVVASGEDSFGACVVSAERLASLTEGASEIQLYVRISTGGDFIDSPPVIVGIVDAPTLEMTVAPTLTVQPLLLDFTSNTAANIAITVTSQGGQSAFPDGVRTQVIGDTVYSALVIPEWQGEGELTATVALPPGLEFWENVKYTITATATDPETQLTSELVTGECSVAWAHQAPAPPDSLTVFPSDEVDEDGNRTLQCSISLSKAEGMLDTDVYDIYRITPDGAYLVAVGLAQDAIMTDPYAPFGGTEKGYRVAVRTADGDVNYADYDYELPCLDLRIDWGNEYVELPYNLSMSDAYTKDFETRAHLGESTPQGYWNENIARQASLSTDVVKITEQAKQATLRSLAQYDGAVFVRTPMGNAYQANVNVGGLEVSHDSAACAVSLDASEVGLTQEFMAIVPIPEDNPIVEPAQDTFTGTGSQTAFTLTSEPIEITNVTVDDEVAVDYTVSGNTITFDEAPESSAAIVVLYTKASE